MQQRWQPMMHGGAPPQPSPSTPSEMSYAKQALRMFESDATPINDIHSYNNMILKIASNMRAEWEWLAGLLKVSEADIHAIRMSIHSVTEQAVQMLRQWLITNTSRATLNVLTKAVYNAGPQYWHLLNIITKHVITARSSYGTLV